MNRFARIAVASIAVAATALVPVSQSFAGDRYHGSRFHQGHVHKRYHHHGKRPVIIHRDRSGDALAAGMLGLAIGAIIAGAATAPMLDPYPPVETVDPGYYPAPPAYNPGPAYYAGTVEPWTSAWYEYCTQRFRSFDPQSGTYLGFDGKRHFCVAK